MKQLMIIVTLCICISICTAAQEFPSYGSVSGEELALRQISFDKDANAVVLLHEAYSDYDDHHRLITLHHIRVKILKEEGKSAADVSIPFYRKEGFESIDQVEGMTINEGNGGQIQKIALERKNVFYKNTNDRIGEVVFAFPAVKTGSIIDYKFRSTMKHYGGLEDWNFQQALPVVTSRYTLIILPNAEFAYRVHKRNEMPVIVKQLSSNGGVYFEMNQIPGLGNEPYIDARRDYLQKVVFQLSAYAINGGKNKYMTSWNELNKELNSAPEFGGQLDKRIEGTGDFIKTLVQLPTQEEKMKTVFNYVRDNMTWNGLYSKYVDVGVRTAWKKKSGTSGEINLILVNLLKEADLEAYPVLVSERFHGKVNTDYPFIDQFNTVFACVQIGSKRYYLDATDKLIPPHLTPSGILNTLGFIVKRKAGEVVKITNDTVHFKEVIMARAELAGDGSLTGDVTINSYDYARMIKLDDYKKDKEKFARNYFVVGGTSIGAKEVKVNNLLKDSMPLEQVGQLTGSLNRTGDYLFLPLNIFTGFDSNPFLSDNRFSNINFGFTRYVNLNMSVKLPEGFVVDELPKSVRLTNPDQDIVFARQVEYRKQDGVIQCLLSFQFKESLYEWELYPMVKEMYKKMFDYLKEPVILKRGD